MKIRNRVMFALALALGVLATVYIWIAKAEGQAARTATLQKTVATVEKFINYEVTEDIQNMQIAMDLLSRDPILIKFLKEKNKENLIHKTRPVFEQLKKKNEITHFNFYGVNRAILVRLNELGHLDNLIESKILKEVETTGRPSFDIEQDSIGATTLRVVYPMYNGKTKIGYIELGKELQNIVNKIENIAGLEIFVLVNKSVVQKSMWKKRNNTSSYSTKWDFLPSDVIIASTMSVIPEGLSGLKFDNLADSGYVIDGFLIKTDKALYEVMALPLYDMSSKKVAQVVLLYDSSAILKAEEKSILITASVTFFIMLSLMAFFYFFLGRVDSMMIQQQASLVSSSKMASLGEMAGGVAHEINTPLGALIINAQMLIDHNQEQIAPDIEIETRTQAILKIADRIAKIVSGLKGFAREAKDTDIEVFAVKDWVSETLNLCYEKFKKHNLEIKVKDQNMDVKIRGQMVGLSQVLLNLLGNSFDAVHKTENSWVAIEAAIQNGKVEISVTDSGMGIPTGVVARIFEPFFTTKDIGVGTGLGLSISKGIINAQKGDLFYDHQNKNTRFVIQLPIYLE